jgi:hypothetical protein
VNPSLQAVCFLWHFPSRRRDWALPSTLSCEARTFLPSASGAKRRSLVLLPHTRIECGFFHALCLSSPPALGLLETFVVTPIDDSVAVGTIQEGIPSNQFIEFLGGDAHVAGLAYSIDHRADGQSAFTFSQEIIPFQQIPVKGLTELDPLFLKVDQFPFHPF